MGGVNGSSTRSCRRPVRAGTYLELCLRLRRHGVPQSSVRCPGLHCLLLLVWVLLVLAFTVNFTRFNFISQLYCGRVYRPFIPAPHLQCLLYCNAIVRTLCNRRAPTDPCFYDIDHTIFNIGDGKGQSE